MEGGRFFNWGQARKRFVPEGRILVYSLFTGLALAPGLAFLGFRLLGTVPEGYTVSQFYRDVRIDLFHGVWIAWALVLSPYFLVQLFRTVRWAVTSLKESITSS